jgi:hypothetical protein
VPPHRKTFLGTIYQDHAVLAVFGTPRDRIDATGKLLGYSNSLTLYGLKWDREREAMSLEGLDYTKAIQAVMFREKQLARRKNRRYNPAR